MGTGGYTTLKGRTSTMRTAPKRTAPVPVGRSPGHPRGEHSAQQGFPFLASASLRTKRERDAIPQRPHPTSFNFAAPPAPLRPAQTASKRSPIGRTTTFPLQPHGSSCQRNPKRSREHAPEHRRLLQRVFCAGLTNDGSCGGKRCAPSGAEVHAEQKAAHTRATSKPAFTGSVQLRGPQESACDRSVLIRPLRLLRGRTVPRFGGRRSPRPKEPCRLTGRRSLRRLGTCSTGSESVDGVTERAWYWARGGDCVTVDRSVERLVRPRRRGNRSQQARLRARGRCPSLPPAAWTTLPSHGTS